MNTHADKTQENKNQAVATAHSQKQSVGESSFQFVDNRPETIVQRKLHEMANNSPQLQQAAQLQAMANSHYAQHPQPIQKKENNTGLPDQLKSGIENLSGYSMDDVKVHRNSDKPAQLQAHAYAQGTDIHLGPGQEKHLPHEAWHVVQQKQGRVKPTIQMKGKVNVNDDVGLEKEADVMGSKAIQLIANLNEKGPQRKQQRIIEALPKVHQQRIVQKNISLQEAGGLHAGSFSMVRIQNGQKSEPSYGPPLQLVKIRLKQQLEGPYEEFDTNSATLEELKSMLPKVHLEDREKLQNAILDKWGKRVRSISDSHTQVGPNAGKPAAYDQIELGPFRGKNPYEVSARDEMDPVSVGMGITREEEEALYRYSQGGKDERDSPGYMDEGGWRDLETAVSKIPSMGELGRVATVFRADRKADFTKFLMSRIGKPCYIEHGTRSTEAGVQHLASAAFTVNSHGMRENEPKGKGMQLGQPQKLALTRIICFSARYIQYWGMHGASLDGGEVLIPSGTITYYDGEHPNTEPFGGVPRKIFTLIEVSKEEQRAKPLPAFDDFRGEVV